MNDVSQIGIAVSLLLLAVWMFLQIGSGSRLTKAFASLGTLTGKTKSQIIAVAGQPSSITAADGGKVVLQWISPSYHIALLFDGEICEGVTHESKT